MYSIKIINHYINRMIKYALLENKLLADSNGCVSVVTTAGTKDLNDILNLMVDEGSGLTLPQAMAYFEKLSQIVEYYLEEGYKISTPLFRIQPTMRGVFDNPSDTFDPSRHKLRFCTCSGSRLKKLAAQTKLEKTKTDIFQQVPVITGFFNEINKVINTAAISDGSGVITGKWLKFNPDDSRLGIFFISENNPSIVIRMTGYTEIKPSKVHFRIPFIPPGKYRIIVRNLSRDKSAILQGELKLRIIVE